MAYKDSGEIANNSNYALGDYSFRIERTSVPGSTNDKIEAICTKDGRNARKSIQVASGTKLLGWYVEANSDTADVYAVIEPNDDYEGNIPHPIAAHTGDYICTRTYPGGDQLGYETYLIKYLFASGSAKSIVRINNDNITVYFVSPSSFGGTVRLVETDNIHGWADDDRQIGTFNGHENTIHGKPVYVQISTISQKSSISDYGAPTYTVTPNDNDFYSLAYDTGTEEERTVLIGRFAIDLEDAGGVGPGSDWIDPGDYDPDWEEGDPTHTLYVEVTGALSGRHNDPIEDPSYSYIPADKDTVKDYGCGGDGGHGGGGGAGASTVVIHKFATNQANSKEVTAIARRHGYGSGGGKGGKGGDGCILVYY